MAAPDVRRQLLESRNRPAPRQVFSAPATACWLNLRARSGFGALPWSLKRGAERHNAGCAANLRLDFRIGIQSRRRHHHGRRRIPIMTASIYGV